MSGRSCTSLPSKAPPVIRTSCQLDGAIANGYGRFSSFTTYSQLMKRYPSGQPTSCGYDPMAVACRLHGSRLHGKPEIRTVQVCQRSDLYRHGQRAKPEGVFFIDEFVCFPLSRERCQFAHTSDCCWMSSATASKS